MLILNMNINCSNEYVYCTKNIDCLRKCKPIKKYDCIENECVKSNFESEKHRIESEILILLANEQILSAKKSKFSHLNGSILNTDENILIEKRVKLLEFINQIENMRQNNTELDNENKDNNIMTNDDEIVINNACNEQLGMGTIISFNNNSKMPICKCNYPLIYTGPACKWKTYLGAYDYNSINSNNLYNPKGPVYDFYERVEFCRSRNKSLFAYYDSNLNITVCKLKSEVIQEFLTNNKEQGSSFLDNIADINDNIEFSKYLNINNIIYDN